MPPSIIKTISIRDTSKRYYTGYLDNKHYLYSFINNTAADECAYFLGTYKSRYGRFPDINESKYIEIRDPLIFELNRKPLLSIIEEELIVSDENTDDLIEMCSDIGLGLLLIHNFDFKLSSKRIDIKFSARNLIPEEMTRNYIDFEDLP